MSEQLSKLEKSVEDVLEIVVSMKGYIENNLVTKEELSKELGSLEKKLEKRMDVGFEEVNSKIDGLNRRIDNEVENRAQIETRVRKVEEVVFPA